MPQKSRIGDRRSALPFRRAKGKRHRKRLGPKAADRRAGEDIAKKINAALAVGTFDPIADSEQKPIRAASALRAWHRTYSPTFKTSFERTAISVIEKHLAPYSGCKELGEITEQDLLRYSAPSSTQGASPPRSATGSRSCGGCSTSPSEKV